MDFELTENQRELQERATAAGLLLRGKAADWDREDRVSYDEVVACIRDHDLMALTMPPELGGKGLSALDYLIVVEALFRSSQFWIAGEPVFATTGPGPSMLLLADDDATRKKFLPNIVTGKSQCAIALTEPGYGSDLTSLESTVERDGDTFVVNGSKNFVTGAMHNDLYAVFVRFDEIPGYKGIGAVIIEDGTPGVTVSAGPEFLGCRGVPHGDLELTDVRIPAENVIVGPGRFPDLMGAFNMERLHNCAFNLGMATAAYDEAMQYVNSRHAFGRPIGEFQSVYHALVDMWTDLEALRLLAQRAASAARDGKFPPGLETTAAKLFGARIASGITLKALELHGGYGATKDFVIERIHRDVVSTIVAGGSPPILRNSIAAELLPNLRLSQRR
ncbi:acyl-CoA dehydrogenase family protein [Mycobacterium sp. 1274756.6]|uniref:acyl-CoA dehydrogenase family protein n=1 Tax=Mycobacterium sp. 1274756.6 TaxID=1834076 RepID=UPI0007FCDABD|nr:acyl-CoA dehydrogenase family protein [Mycobacterium sp. 1274756.6]OBJ70767.1 isovaleryl-CoA dehydrogenase [Mycobacterium sp. 1274756.6]